MNLRKDKWNLATMFPLDTCDEYASCGPNSICSPNRPIRCECLRGFAPKFQTDWDFQDWSGGCTRTRLLNCQDGDGFLSLRGVKYPDMLRFWLNTTMSLESTCNLKSYSLQIILISIASGLLISAFISGGVARLKKRAMTQNNEDLELPVMKMTTTVQATNNFSMENMIGVGGFGPVYKGNMPSGEEIAVKRLSRSSGQGLEEFRNEVMVIAKLQHRNLVRLLGCGIEKEERILVYEYLQNKSLDYFVFDNSRRALLTWPKRLLSWELQGDCYISITIPD
ncbi:G-type lectin S-receptor-like serine/threonine-protein kinase At4g27290 [Salvia splendens]|uniref:G-type lectin S-receptor-like serine/threonine-protein kinase At4g27290 n=1 Tax=Salvia splendens TaxID=180675 RepID=UPI001C2554B2|nr:G-type lectin S-receptor-like serine/threonine-protein kinase At4g27290 [Salvia splendens]